MTRPSPRAILLCGWLGFLLYAYPGYLNTEAVDQLIDARIGQFTDWHSPMMTLVWRIVSYPVAGPAGMLVLQSLMLLVGAQHLLRRAMSARAAALAACGLLLFPPVTATVGLICPEAQLAGFFLVGLDLLLSPRRAVKVAGLGAILIGGAMRPGGMVAALPIVALAFLWTPAHRGLARYARALAVWVAVAAVGGGVSWLVVDRETQRPALRLAALDVAGTLAKAGPIDDAEIAELLEGLVFVAERDLQQHARAAYARSHSIMAGADRVFETPQTSRGTQRLIDARRTLALAHPGAYLAHRWRQAVRVLGFVRGTQWKPLVATAVGNPDQRDAAGHAARHSPVQRLLVAPVRWLSTGVLFRPYVYLAIALILLPLAIRRRARDAVLLLASGIAYELALFVVTSDAAYRYSHWLVVTTLLAVVLMIARGCAEKRR